ncbi:MAG: hypothetical protein IKN54_02295 [Lachnospiraceae bacterium]|nr:hypothetical protein [Lachnospiraceae bacterium]
MVKGKADKNKIKAQAHQRRKPERMDIMENTYLEQVTIEDITKIEIERS